ncbi:PROTEIN RALF-LIKE 27-RELATED [Salix koriyanagi]|uniref:PROTEIN RALF-LIKE 27-RELATED n=1 Tax=Salix koriyanagi TaxID=2511006 RepID=A0A9Q0VR50_9ROSI|nr:PROTEIN RALF-LIKE 27-RELATED [Salix koriyanagi]
MRPKLSVEFLWRLSLTILLVSAITSTSTAAVLKRNSSPIFNATIGEGNEEEFSMDSEVHQRLIASQNPSIAYRSLEQQPVCNAQIYGNCVKQVNPGSRPCTYYNRCKRAV